MSTLTVSTTPRLGKVLVKPQMAFQRFLIGLFQALISFGLLLGIWSLISQYSKALPNPAATLTVLWELVSNPFYDNGPSDKGIGFSLLSSMSTVGQGFLLGSVVAIPLGILMGLLPWFSRIINPIAQMLRPVSPLAWFPLALIVSKSALSAGVFVIFITSLWSTLMNTSFGVAGLPKDYRTLATVYQFTPWRNLTRIILPYALPFILTGLRLSLGTAWMVIVAAEMLSGGIGIGFFVVDAWNSASLERIISAIIIIGAIGLVLDRIMEMLVKKASHGA